MFEKIVALFHDDSFLLTAYAVSSACELCLTLVLFYIARKSNALESNESERTFHLSNFLIMHSLIEQLRNSGLTISKPMLEANYQSLRAVFGEEPAAHNYEAYETFVREKIGDPNDEETIDRMLSVCAKERARLQFADTAAFILLMLFQVFSIWYVLQP